MLRFLSAEALYRLLLVTTFASVGLLGLWTATSRWHPFLRTTIVLAILSVLLLRPMFEPFVMLVSQVATIAVGVIFYRWLKNRKQATATDAKRTRYQFSLKTLLFVSTLVAIGAAVVAKTPELGWQFWLSIIGNGASAGLGSLCAAIVAAPKTKWWNRFLSGMGAIAFYFFAITPSLQAFAVYINPFQIHQINRPIGYQLLLAFAAITAIAQIAIILAIRSNAVDFDLKLQNLNQRVTRPLGFLMLLLLLIFPIYSTWQLLNPPSPPPLNTMKPNAYHELVVLGKKLDNSSVIANFTAHPLNVQKLSQAVAANSNDYQYLDRLLSQPSILPKPLTSWEDSLADRRTLARFLDARREALYHKGDFGGALHSSMQTVRLANAFQGGVVVDYLVSIAIEGIGFNGTYPLINHLNAVECQSAIDALFVHEQSRDTFDDVTHRELLWTVHNDGWWGHLCGLMGTPRNAPATVVTKSALERSQAVLRLLVLELTLHKYQLTHNTYPDRLDQLVPDILPEVPRDPFDPAGGPVRYKKTGESYILYSVSQNGVDDGGVPPNESGTKPSDWKDWWRLENGDLRLDHYFAEPSNP